MHHTPALILKRDEWGEGDWLVVALTPRFGKIRLRAQGARKAGAKLGGHLEPGSVSDISFVVGRGGLRLTAARLSELFPRTRASWSKLRAQVAVLAAADFNLLEEREGAGGIFSLAVSALAAIEGTERLGTVNRVLAWFQASLLRLLGLLPAPGTPEAREIPTLLAIAGEPLGRLDEHAGGGETLAVECRMLARQLGSAARIIMPVAAARPVT